MKTKLIIKTMSAAALAAVACLAAWPASAQENISGDLFAGWVTNPLLNGGGAPPAAFPVTVSDANVTVGALMKGSGIGAITTGGVYGGANWTNTSLPDNEANSIANGLYLTYTVTPNAQYTISFTTNILYFHNSATGPINGELQYEIGNGGFMDAVPIIYSATHAAQTTSVTNVLSGVAALQNIAPLTTVSFRIVNWGASGTAGTWYINNGATPVTAPDFLVIGTISSPGVAPFNVNVTPASIATNSGGTAAFTVTAQGDAASNYWYKVVGATTSLIPTATTSTLTLPNVTGNDAASYFVVVSNASSVIPGPVTSSVVTLSVVDPYIVSEPSSTFGLLDGEALFAVTAAGAGPQYQWWTSDINGNPISMVNNGPQTSGSTVFGATSSTLVVSNLHLADATNFIVVVSDPPYGPTVNSTAASLISVSSSAELVFWNFNQTNFPNNLANPAPWFGVGTASAVGSALEPGVSPFAGSVDSIDGPGFGLGTTNFSWGTENYPASGTNKQTGVQFNVSTVGAQNIRVSYDSRATQTASDYERLQYTTDGVTWIDYPASTNFNGVPSSYKPFTNNLTGFPGAANNPNFGIRIVTELQTTATYGISSSATYLGTGGTYATTGTLTYDIVGIYGDAITNGPYTPPILSMIMNQSTPDTTPITVPFTVTSAGPQNLFAYSAVSLAPSTINPGFSFSSSAGSSQTLQITPNQTPDSVDVGPILITVTDTNGFSAAAWFDLTLTSVNLPPTNTLTAITATNTLANTSITIPFKVTDDRTPSVSGQNFTYSASSGNTTVVPVGNITVPSPSQNANVSVSINPASGQLGISQVGITVFDHDLVDPKSTTANFAFMVRPNTNIVFIDYFNYDNGGSLDVQASNTWGRLSGPKTQMQVSTLPTGGAVTVDTVDNTENVQAALFGGPYKTNTGTVLYSSFVVNMDPLKSLPTTNGTYFALFNDGSGTTGNYECRVLAATNGAAAGKYRLGIVNFGADATDGQMFQQDLMPGSNYVVVTALVVSNGLSTIWVNPTSQSSPNVTDTSPAAASGTNLFNIADFELRESGENAGSINVSFLKIGTTFDSVFPSLHVQLSGTPETNAVVTWSDPTLVIQSASVASGPYTDLIGALPPYTNNITTSPATFFRFKR